MDKYQFVKKLGEGAYGIVVKCVNTQTKELVAIKKMKGQYASWEKCINMPEVQALKKLNNSQYLIKIKEMVHNKKENEVNIVFEYCDKNLFQEMQDRSRKNQQFTEQEIKIIMYQALAGVQYMHQNGFMHRDIKPENFLVSNDSSEIAMKLADFGLAKDFRRNRGGNHTEYVATRWYRAPELVLRSQNYDQSVDVFALGCIMAELFLGRPLFPGSSETDQLTRIVTILGTPSQSEWPEGHRLTQQKGIRFPNVQGNSLRQHFSNRFDISEEAFDVMLKMLKYDSGERITAQNCMSHNFFKDVPQSVKSQPVQQQRRRVQTRLEQPPAAQTYEVPSFDYVKPEVQEAPKNYQTGAVAQVSSIPSPQLKANRLEKAKKRLGGIGDSQTLQNPYSNNFPQTLKPIGSKMETYEQKPIRNSQYLKDDFLDKMMNDNNNNLGSTFYKQKQENQQKPYQLKPKFISNNHSGEISQSQSVGLLPIQRTGSRLDEQQPPPYSFGVNMRGGLGGVGGNIISSNGVNSSFPNNDYGAVLQPNKFTQGSSSAIPVGKPQPVSNTQFSSLGQSLMQSPEKQHSKKGAAAEDSYNVYSHRQQGPSKLPSSHGRPKNTFGGAAMGILNSGKNQISNNSIKPDYYNS